MFSIFCTRTYKFESADVIKDKISGIITYQFEGKIYKYRCVEIRDNFQILYEKIKAFSCFFNPGNFVAECNEKRYLVFNIKHDEKICFLRDYPESKRNFLLRSDVQDLCVFNMVLGIKPIRLDNLFVVKGRVFTLKNLLQKEISEKIDVNIFTNRVKDQFFFDNVEMSIKRISISYDRKLFDRMKIFVNSSTLVDDEIKNITNKRLDFTLRYF